MRFQRAWLEKISERVFFSFPVYVGGRGYGDLGCLARRGLSVQFR